MPIEISKLKVKVTTKPVPPFEKIFSGKQLQLIDSEMRDEEGLKEYIQQYYLGEFIIDKIKIIESEE